MNLLKKLHYKHLLQSIEILEFIVNKYYITRKDKRLTGEKS